MSEDRVEGIGWNKVKKDKIEISKRDSKRKNILYVLAFVAFWLFIYAITFVSIYAITFVSINEIAEYRYRTVESAMIYMSAFVASYATYTLKSRD
ncbi:hypothetical protein [uncultured Gammaproteobacteria bacterium]|jgi:hypothetical protein|nr:hypothetical protein [uncultured Gammaproteobacteria bacterium]